MWYSISKNKITQLSAMLLCLTLTQSLLGQIPNYQITQLPVYQLYQISNQSLSGQDDIAFYLPQKNETGTWQPTGSPEKAVGEDLFLLINGGAEIYHEYGFKQTIMQSYENENGKSINLEIFEMENPASAYGIYSFKTSGRGKEIPLGDKASLEDYYLNFWKGNFLVTITGFDSEQETIDGLITIAKVINSKIKSKGQIPLLIRLLPEENLRKSGVKYLKGNLALFNNYEFGTGDLFGLNEGVIGDYDQYKVFIFKYDDKNESEKWFENAKNNIKSNARFDIYDISLYSEYSVFGRKEDRIFMKLYYEYIIIVVGTMTTKTNKIIEKVQSKIKNPLE